VSTFQRAAEEMLEKVAVDVRSASTTVEPPSAGAGVFCTDSTETASTSCGSWQHVTAASQQQSSTNFASEGSTTALAKAISNLSQIDVHAQPKSLSKRLRRGRMGRQLQKEVYSVPKPPPARRQTQEVDRDAEEGRNLETALRQVAGSGHLGWLAHFVSGSDVPSSSALGSREIQTARLDEERSQSKQVSHCGRPKQGGDEGMSHTAERRGGRMGRPRPPPTWFSSIGATSHNSELSSVAVPASQGPSVFNSHGETHSV